MRIRPQIPHRALSGRRPGGRRLRVALLAVLLAVGYLLSPYLTLYRLNGALVRNDRDSLAALVDLDSIRGEILRKLNKDRASDIGPLSDAFIDWLQEGIRRNGTDALSRQVNLEWVRAALLAHSPPGRGLGAALTRAFFDDPLRFSVRLARPGKDPVVAEMRLRPLGWQLTALHY